MEEMGAMTVRVSNENIADGLPGSENGCPVALAMADRDLFAPVATQGHLYWGRSSRHMHPTPEHVARFINDFDEGKQVGEIEFTLPDWK